ncbi:MAG: DUF1538 domain-containing protein [Bacillota bacterium]|nr:DUF1538 domain-containing protein [Bacillota bacterium]HOB91210.1 DUF1538 domain-containing protein [Bacillota bacterium]HPZ54337.1 DUF1538 domain-containing protein [Bacillota bacterium]HQD17620.1 DUF1538 domain-containing protein [Bacillota bacterium]
MARPSGSARAKLASVVKRIGGSAHVQDLWTTVVDTLIGVLPIVGFLLFVQLVILRVPLANPRQIFIGIVCSIVGLTLFSQGLKLGLLPLGEEAGQNLPRAGKMWVVLTVGFIMGYGVTLAEPALHSLGLQVEEYSAGLVTKNVVIHSVAIGVGLAILLGLLKIIFRIPLIAMVGPLYAIAILLALVAPKSIVGPAFDSGGVTTGPVTVPITIAIGVGMANALGGRDPLQDGFGLVTLAVVCPIISVLLVGTIIGYR